MEQLKSIDIDVDQLIINEINKEYEKLNNDIMCLKDSYVIIQKYSLVDINSISNTTNSSKKNIEVVNSNIEQIPNKKKIIHVIISAVICGALCSGIGGIFGVIPAIGFAGVGVGAGSLIGNYF